MEWNGMGWNGMEWNMNTHSYGRGKTRIEEVWDNPPQMQAQTQMSTQAQQTHTMNIEGPTHNTNVVCGQYVFLPFIRYYFVLVMLILTYPFHGVM